MKKILINSMLSLGVALSSSSFAMKASETVTIQAESYTSAATGVQKETTTDTGNGQNVGYLDTGRWMTYSGAAALDLPCDGDYKIDYRVASQNGGGKISFMKDGGTPTYGSINVDATGGYQTWKTISHTIKLPKGALPYTLFSTQGGWNINWFSITAPACVPPIDPNVAIWLMDKTKSSFHFVSVKKTNTGGETGENFTFDDMVGTVAVDGKASMVIQLNSISSGIDIRNTRMKESLFETQYLPKAYFQTQLDLAAIDALEVGAIKTMPLNGTVTLHGIVKAVAFDAVIVKQSAGSVSVSPRKPLLINSADFELNFGLQVLKNLAGLASIGQVAPVYFNIQLTKDNPTKSFIVAVPTRPVAPIGLLGNVSQATANVNLTWTDASTNETGFLIRKKGTDGLWQTLGLIKPDSVTYSPVDQNFGTFSYKVVAINENSPSDPSNIETLTYQVVSTSSSVRSSEANNSLGFNEQKATRGELVFKGAANCQGCHKDANKDGWFDDGIYPLHVNDFALALTKGYRINTVDDLANFIYVEMGPKAGAITQDQSLDAAHWLWSLRGQIKREGACSTSDPIHFAPRTIKLLTSYEYANSLQALFPNIPLPKDYGSVQSALEDATARNIPTHTTVQIEGTRLNRYNENAAEIALWAITNRTLPFSCANRQDATCQNNFVTQFATKAMRRPLTDVETSAYKAIVAASPTGLQVAVQSVLMSPQFLYRSERGVDLASVASQPWANNDTFKKVLAANNGAFVLDPYELASMISYMYTGSSPDATLLSLAASGDLYADSVLDAQIDRLLDTPKGREQTLRFANMYANTTRLDELARDDLTGANKFTPAVRASMSEEMRQLYSQVFYGGKPLSDLFAGNFTVLNKTLSDFYGIPSNSANDNDWQVVDTTASRRGGIIASGAYMTKYAHTKITSPIKRAVHVRQDFLCQDIPLPTNFEDPLMLRAKRLAEVNDLLQTKGMTTAAYWHALTTTPGSNCLDCHAKMINPMFAMDDFDNIGRLRAVDGNNQVVQSLLDVNVAETGAKQAIDIVNQGGRVYAANRTGSVNFTEINALPESDGALFRGSKELSKLFVANEAIGIKSCFINKSYRYTTGLPLDVLTEDPIDSGLRLTDDQRSQNACIQSDLKTGFENSSNPRALIKKIGMQPAMRFRR